MDLKRAKITMLELIVSIMNEGDVLLGDSCVNVPTLQELLISHCCELVFHVGVLSVCRL